MKKMLHLRREELEELYCGRGLSLSQIGERYGCEGTNILYWLKKYKIPRRPAHRKKTDIEAKVLQELYWNQKLSADEIGKRYGIWGRTVRKKLVKFGIPTKTLSEANTRKMKRDFLGNLVEKAYLLGLRTGDFHAKWIKKCVRVQTTTTHRAQVELLESAFSKYGECRKYYSRNKSRSDEWFIYVDLNSSFDFLVEKPAKIPRWILENDECFFAFLTAYADCEGAFSVIRSHKNSFRFIFRISSGDKRVLEQLTCRLREFGYHVRFYFKDEKGRKGNYGTSNLDIYELILYRKKETLHLIPSMLHHSKHSEKVRKMKFMLERRGCEGWNELSGGWKELRAEITKELLKNMKLENAAVGQEQGHKH